LKASLVVLSACETGRGKIKAGEGIIGFTWAFFIAGTPSAVVSQWKVESNSTTQLMRDFHLNLKRSGSKSDALRKAVVKLLRQPQYSHPFYWAGFVLVGDPS
jgi:CHAT domain-containing protein